MPRARQLRDEPQSGRYPTRGYQQRQPSLERGAADQMDLKNQAPGQSGLRTELMNDEAGELCPLDRRQPYQRLRFSRGAQDATTRRRLQPLVSRRVSRYSDCMKVAIELPSGQAAQLETEAKRLGVSVEDLARAAVTDLLAAPDAAFQASAKRILAQNLELYRRLA